MKAKGDSVTLGCTYVVAPSETGNLDIEWSKMNPDSTGLDTVVGIKDVYAESSKIRQIPTLPAPNHFPEAGARHISIMF